jgi:PAS domain-containing protein
MTVKPAYEELEKRINHLEKELADIERTQEPLRESENNYQRLFSAASDSIIVVDAETKQITDANETASKLYGYCREEFLRLNVIELSAEPEKPNAHIEKVTSGKPDIVSPGPVRASS